MPNNNPDSSPEVPDISEINLRRLESEIAKNKADQQKSEIEAEEIRKRLNQKWYENRIFVQTGIGAIVAAALIAAWFVGFFEPMLSHKQHIESLKNDMLSLENKRQMLQNEVQLENNEKWNLKNKAQQEDNERITSSLMNKLASLQKDNKFVSEALATSNLQAKAQKMLLEKKISELQELNKKSTAGEERPKLAAREQVLEKQIESIDKRIKDIGKAQQSTKKRTIMINRDSIYTANTSTLVREEWWDWTVFIAGDDSTLKGIEYVEYTLHPTFPDPIRKVRTKGPTSGKGFSLSASGWGTFMIKVKIMFKDGYISELSHHLKFSRN